MRFAVYVVFCADFRFYVGMTKLWRVKTRWEEHLNPAFVAARWTTKYVPLFKFPTIICETRSAAESLEKKTVEHIMALLGLDSVRGGQWNMITEGDSWWVPKHLRDVPRFTPLWESSRAEYMSFVSTQNASSLFESGRLSLLSERLVLPATLW